MNEIKYKHVNAIEEWKVLNQIIARLEEVEYKIRNWMFGLVTALTIAYISKEITIEPKHFLLFSIALVMLFCLVDLIHRIPKRRAIDRAKEIETKLKKCIKEYDGPNISESITKPRAELFIPELIRMICHTPYVFVFLMLLVIYKVAS